MVGIDQWLGKDRDLTPAERREAGRVLHESLVRAVERSYAAQGIRVLTFPNGNGHREGGSELPDVVVPELGRMEVAETDETLENLGRDRLQSLKDSGFDVWVLVPRGTVSEARKRLRGVVDRLQTWWLETVGADTIIVFGEPRIP